MRRPRRPSGEKGGQEGPGRGTVHGHVVSGLRDRGWRLGTGLHCLTPKPTHHAVHHPGDVLAHGAADGHASHHRGWVEPAAGAAAHLGRAAGAHLAERVGAGDSHLSLLLELEGADVGGLGGHALRALGLLALDAQSLLEVLGVDALLVVEVLDVDLGLGLDGGLLDVARHGHELAVAVARLVEFDDGDVHAGDLDAEVARETLLDLGLHGIVNPGEAALDLDERDAEVRGGVATAAFT